MLLAEARNRRWIKLESIPRGDRGDLFRLWPAVGEKIDQLLEILLESGGRDDLQEAGFTVALVPERVPLATWLVDQIPRFAVNDVVAEKGANSPTQNVA